MRTVGLLLIDYCMCISLAMFSGLVRMLLFLSMIQSSGGVSWFLKIFLFIFFGLVSYSCLYFDMAFLMLSKVCFVVILRTWVLAGLARLANVLIMSCCLSLGLEVGVWCYDCDCLFRPRLGVFANLMYFLLCRLFF